MHISSGVSALICALVIGKRKGFGHDDMRPHNLTYTVLGAANAPFEAALAVYRANYPDGGGDFLLQAQGDLRGLTHVFTLPQSLTVTSSDVGQWLWRQGGAGIDQPGAWWINFGTVSLINNTPLLTGFSGLGTLGGGNATISARMYEVTPNTVQNQWK